MDEHNESQTSPSPDPHTKLSRNRDIGLSRITGGLSGILALLIPVMYFWLSNSKEVSLAQIKNNAEQIAYITRTCTEQMDYKDARKLDAEKERDLYKTEMLACQQELRKLKK